MKAIAAKQREMICDFFCKILFRGFWGYFFLFLKINCYKLLLININLFIVKTKIHILATVISWHCYLASWLCE